MQCYTYAEDLLIQGGDLAWSLDIEPVDIESESQGIGKNYQGQGQKNPGFCVGGKDTPQGNFSWRKFKTLT